VRLPKVGHGFSVPRNWMPQFRAAFAAFARPASASAPQPEAGVDDLPLTVVAARRPGDTLAVLLSGDGGWAGLDRAVASSLAASGVAVVGWDSLRYYWTPRTPDTAARDLARVLQHYRTALKRPRIVLIGYSFGADVLPFLARRLPAELKRDIAKIVLLGPGPRANFEFKLTNWLGGNRGGLDVYSEAVQLSGMSLLCVRGVDERDSLCPRLATMARTVTLPGGHHFDRDYAGLARLILE
jgi:type IV secretory pathway VirJ component